jgi:hypothetical protein
MCDWAYNYVNKENSMAVNWMDQKYKYTKVNEQLSSVRPRRHEKVEMCGGKINNDYDDSCVIMLKRMGKQAVPKYLLQVFWSRNMGVRWGISVLCGEKWHSPFSLGI